MPDSTADGNLLFGLLALQNGLIDQDQLVDAFRAWTRDRSRPLADHFVARGGLDADQRSAVAALVALHVKKHGGSAEKSLAAVPVGRSTRESLAQLGDPEVEATLGHVGSGHGSTEHEGDGEADADRTASLSVGSATSDGQRFRVLRPHARGGLGAVFVALDTELHREVALKQILDSHADDTISRTRFLLEAEVTGGLEHPGIVPVYGLGTYGDGRPYYAMRFIRGDSLKEAIEHFHADESLKTDPGRRSLELRKLLRRFTDVCNAIDYAHSRGVLHRDLKPGNIIVGKHGETLVVDWGLAKVMSRAEPRSESGERTLIPSSASGSAETLPGSALGTPAYMSPEQAEGNLEHLGPRSDVYSLGSTLYCLLTGKPPFEGEVADVIRGVQRGAFRLLRAVEPSIDPALEAVCLKTMALKPADRYGSPRSLAEDLERWMADEPVSAFRAPVPVRLARWARKHRTGVAVGAALLQTAVVVLAVSTLLLGQSRARIEREQLATERARQAAVSEQQAAERAREEAETARQDADRQRQSAVAARGRAEAVNAFLIRDLLAQADPENNPVGEQLTVRALLDKAAASLGGESSLKARPEVESAVRAAIGSAYLGLGLGDPALTQLTRAVNLAEASSEVPVAERLVAANRLMGALLLKDRIQEAQAMGTTALRLCEEQLGPAHPETVLAASNLARAYRRQLDRAIPIYRKTLEGLRKARGPEDRLTLTTAHNLAQDLVGSKRPEDVKEAEAIERSFAEVAPRVLGPDHPTTLSSLGTLGRSLLRQRKDAEAKAVLTPLRDRYARVFGSKNPKLAGLLSDLGRLAERAGQYDEAQALYLEAYAVCRETYSINLIHYNELLVSAARVDLARGRTAAAASRLQRLQGILLPLGDYREDLAEAMAGTEVPRKDEQSLTYLKRYAELDSWPGDWLAAYSGSLWAWCRLRQGRVTEAAPVLRDALKQMEANPDTPARILVEVRERVERLKRVESDPKSLVELTVQTDTELDALRAAVHHRPADAAASAALADALYARKDYEGAQASYRESQRRGTRDAKVYLHAGNCSMWRNGMSFDTEVLDAWRAAIRLDPDLAEAHVNLGFALYRIGELPEALRELERGHELGVRNPRWPYDSSHNTIRQCRDALEADTWLLSQLPGFLEKGSRTAGAGEFLLFAEFCNRKHRYATGVSFWTKAFAAEPELATSLKPSLGSYFNLNRAACHAAMAGIGEGTDSDTTDTAVRARLRKQALDWLREDLLRWEKQLQGDRKPSLGMILASLRSEEIDADLRGIRDAEWLARWPEEEQKACRAYWADHDAVLKKYDVPAKR